MAGTFVAVVGPSGAGKDTLIAAARQRLAAEAGFAFPRRIVTREASTFEDHDTVTSQSFEAARLAGQFALTWHAHGLGYAIPAAAIAAVEGGAVVTCNVSRRAVGETRRLFPMCHVVLVTAPREMLHRRLLARGREAPETLSQRLDREAEPTDTPADLVIVNDGAVDDAAMQFAAFLRSLRVAALQPVSR